MIQQSQLLDSFNFKGCLRKPRKRLKFPQHRYRRILYRTMLHIHKTKHIRKLDTAGRLLIPIGLRKEYNITDSQDLPLYILQDTDTGRMFLGIEVDQPQTNKIEDMLKAFNYQSVDELMKDIQQYAQNN